MYLGSPHPPNAALSNNNNNNNLMDQQNMSTAQMVNAGNVTINEFLLELAKVANERLNTSQTVHHAAHQSPRRHSIDMKNTSTPILKSGSEYPEVTLHPVSTNHDSSGASASNSNSLLHGILTKQHNSRQQQQSAAPTTNTAGFTSFSPTLARLLTAPERIAPLIPGQNTNNNIHSFHAKSLLGHDLSGGGVNLTNKPKSEITITPVMNSMMAQSLQQSLMQNQLEHHQLQQHQQRLQQRQEATNMHQRTKNPESFVVVSFRYGS